MTREQRLRIPMIDERSWAQQAEEEEEMERQRVRSRLRNRARRAFTLADAFRDTEQERDCHERD